VGCADFCTKSWWTDLLIKKIGALNRKDFFNTGNDAPQSACVSFAYALHESGIELLLQMCS